MQILSYLGLKLLLMEDILSDFLDHNSLWSKLSKEERHIGTLASFRTMIRKKAVTLFLEGCGSECSLCLG